MSIYQSSSISVVRFKLWKINALFLCLEIAFSCLEKRYFLEQDYFGCLKTTNSWDDFVMSSLILHLYLSNSTATNPSCRFLYEATYMKWRCTSIFGVFYLLGGKRSTTCLSIWSSCTTLEFTSCTFQFN